MCIKYVKCEDGYNELLLQRLNLSESNLIQQSILQQQQQLQQEQNIYTIHYTANDLNLIETFVKRLKFYSGQWSKHGLQRVVRLNAACSRNYVSLRKSRVKADVPAEEAFKDPYTLIEQQIFRKFVALKSTQSNRYVCYNTRNGYFHLKSIDMLDKHCIFIFKMNENNQFKFGLGSDMSVYLSFNENGRLVDYYKQMRQFEHNSHHRHHNQINQNMNFQCLNYSNLFYVHTKLSDIAQDFFSNLTPHISIAPVAPTFPSTTTTTTTTPSTTRTITTTTTTTIRRLLAVAKRPAKIRKIMNEKTNPTLELSQQQQQLRQEYRRVTKTTTAPRNRQNLELRKQKQQQQQQQQQRYEPFMYYQPTARATKKPADTKYNNNNNNNNLINYKWSIRKL